MDNRNINVTQHVGEVKEGGTIIGVQVIYQGEPVTIPSQEAIQLHCADLKRIETYNRWADEFYIHEEGKVLPLFASPYDDDGGRKREDLLQTIRSHQRLLVLGEPGMGKTVALERMVWETAKADEMVVPILVQLLYFQGWDLIELIRVALNETRRLTFDNAKSVRAFLRETKCLILFDGLNETPGRQREQVIGAIANFMREYPEHRYVVTSRSQDELWRKLRSAELIQDAVVVQTISDAQAQGYLQAHLGQEKGHALYDRLDASLKSLARTPLLLKLIKDAGGGSDQLPRNRGELFDNYVMNKLLEREQKLELVETPEVKKKALAHLAFALQLNHELACDREWAEKVLAKKGLGAKTDTLLKEALLHGLLIQQTLPDKQLLRFMHQSMQEYFVALMLVSEVGIEKNADLFRAIYRFLSKQNLTAWAKEPWWSESFVQVAGLLDDADWLARRIVNTSPWLAWWCVQEGRDVPENTRGRIEARSIKLLDSPKVAERRRAVQTLAQIKNDRVLEPLLIAAGDDDKEVAGLGVRALVENGKPAQLLVKKALESSNRRSWQASIRYIRSIPTDPLWGQITEWMWDELLETTDRKNVVNVLKHQGDYEAVLKLLRFSGNDDAEAAELAAQVLVPYSEIISPLISDKLHGEDKCYWRAAMRFLGTQPNNPLWSRIPDKIWKEIIGRPMVWIPPGPFLMGSNEKQEQDWEISGKILPQKKVTLPCYWIGQYPVSVAQWRLFVESTGYVCNIDSLTSRDDHPASPVNWNDAMAYCFWLSQKTGLNVILPSEEEWEKAARGTDGRTYPWGNKFDPAKCNTYRYIKGRYDDDADRSGKRTSLGKYSPSGDSPYGCSDMAGNVWEWTRSPDGQYKDCWVLRGGSFLDYYYDARTFSRLCNEPEIGAYHYGFRVMVHPKPVNRILYRKSDSQVIDTLHSKVMSLREKKI